MKSVKSLSELKRMAVQKGATVELGTARFNAGGEKIARLERAPSKSEPPAPAPAPARENAEVNVDMSPVAAAIERAQALQAQMLQSVLQQLAHLQPGQSPQEWEFTVNRNPDGTLARIRAKAIL